MKQKFTVTACLVLLTFTIGILSCKKNKDDAPKTLTVSTFAGSGISGDADGAAATAQFSSLYGMTADPQGNVYLCSGHCIKKITPAGQVSTFAGQYNLSGYADATGTTAMFSNPLGLTIDAQGNLYVADNGNNSIRKITPAGVVSTFAGNGTSGSANGNGSAARFANPYDVAFDATTGNLFVADYVNQKIRKIDGSGNVSTYAGSVSGYADGNVSSALFSWPTGIAVDKQGAVYVSDRFNFRIRKITNTGTVSTVAGTANTGLMNGPAASAQFSTSINELEVDDYGNIYVADRDNNCIRKIAGGEVTTYAGSGIAGFAEGTPSTAQFNIPWGLGISGNTLYVADRNNYRIRRISLQ